MAKADVGNNITRYAQDDEDKCGEATSQMARNGYPDLADRVFYLQDDLKNKIVAHNSQRAADVGRWLTDAKGLSETLQLLSAPPVNWVVLPTASRAEAQAFLQQSLRSTQFPVAAVVNEGQHWVLVVGWETEQAPGGEELKFIRYFDPWPPEVGADHTRAGSTWVRSLHFSRITIPGTWEGKFVVVGQPPR